MTWQIKLTTKIPASILWMKTIDRKLGQKIARQRRAIGLTQAQLAEKVDVQPETISRIETGRRIASLELVARVSRALELELHELFRLHNTNSAKELAVERLIWFASRLSALEIELVMDVGAAVLGHTRRAQPL